MGHFALPSKFMEIITNDLHSSYFIKKHKIQKYKYLAKYINGVGYI